MPLEQTKHISFAYLDSPSPLCDDEPLPIPTWKRFEIPTPSTHKVFKQIPTPKVPCSITLTPPTIDFPPIQRPPAFPIQITVQQDIPAGSHRRYDTVERESNTISKIVDGKTTILCSEGYEKRSKYVTRKDDNGLSHTYCKEWETRNNLVKGGGAPNSSGNPPQSKALASTWTKPKPKETHGETNGTTDMKEKIKETGNKLGNPAQSGSHNTNEITSKRNNKS